MYYRVRAITFGRRVRVGMFESTLNSPTYTVTPDGSPPLIPFCFLFLSIICYASVVKYHTVPTFWS